MNFTESLESFVEKRIKVEKEESETSDFNKLYDKFQVNQDKLVKTQIQDMSHQKVNGHITKCQLIMIISTAVHCFLRRSEQIPFSDQI